jgi:hypothetical protein
MGRVLVGALMFGSLGVLIPAAFATWDLEVELSQPTPGGGRERSFIKVGRPVKRLILTACGATGAIVGAIAGAASSRPDCRPLPRDFWTVLGMLLAFLLVAVALGYVLLRALAFNISG